MLFGRRDVRLLVLCALAAQTLAPSAARAQSTCTELVYEVDARALAGGDGSTLRPFQSLGQALAAADAALACQVRIRVAPGCYREDVSVTRDTRIVGLGGRYKTGPADAATINGTISNDTASSLELTNLSISGANAPGAVVVDHELASTLLDRVTVIGAHEVGVDQRGGTLEVYSSAVIGTSAEGPELHGCSTSGIVPEEPTDLSGVAHSILVNEIIPVSVSLNLAYQADLQAETLYSLPYGNWDPVGSPASGIGIWGHGGAQVWIEDSVVNDNDAIGIALTGYTTEGWISDVQIVGTGNLEPLMAPEPLYAGPAGGIVLTHAATLTAEGVDARYSDFAGIYVEGNPTLGLRPSLTLRDSTLQGTRGAGVQLTDLDLTGVGDGLLCRHGALDLERVLATENHRAGVVSIQCEGAIRDSEMSFNEYGLVVVGAEGLTVADDVRTFDNWNQDYTTDGAVEVPDGLSELPE